MPTTTTHAPGTFCWFELGTTDDAAALKFYSALFGWTDQQHPMGQAGVYHVFQKNGRDAAAGYTMMPEMRKQGIPPHWLAYVMVENVDASAGKAKSLGATVVNGPLDVMEHGRMAVVRDPQGAVFALWQAKGNPGVGILGDPGTQCWTELATPDTAGAQKFYTSLLGWTAEDMSQPGMAYTVFSKDGQRKGGMMPMTPQMGNAPPHWMIYFAVDDAAATARKVQELGGKVHVPPTPIPNIGSFAVFQDPQGAVFSVLQPDRNAM